MRFLEISILGLLLIGILITRPPKTRFQETPFSRGSWEASWALQKMSAAPQGSQDPPPKMTSNLGSKKWFFGGPRWPPFGDPSWEAVIAQSMFLGRTMAPSRDFSTRFSTRFSLGFSRGVSRRFSRQFSRSLPPSPLPPLGRIGVATSVPKTHTSIFLDSQNLTFNVLGPSVPRSVLADRFR